MTKMYDALKALEEETDLVVYSVISPETGPEHRLYGDWDVQALGGIHPIEQELEKCSYWFARLGLIRGERGPFGVTFGVTFESSISALNPPPESAWKTGRRNPAFRGSELERHVFKMVFRAVERMLGSWKRELDGIAEAYALKELNISSEGLESLILGLRSLGRVHQFLKICVVKYWYEPGWPDHHLTDDLILAEYCLTVPLQMRWSAGEEILDVDVMTVALC